MAHAVPNRWFLLDDEWIKINFDARVVNNGERGLGVAPKMPKGSCL